MAKTKGEKPETIQLELVGGSNLTRIKTDINKMAKDNARLDEKIAELRDQKNANRQAVAALGIPKKAFDQAVARHKMDPDKRQEFDHAYQIANEALGFAIDLFTPADEKSDSNPRSAPKPTSAKPPAAKKAAAPKRKPAAKKPKAPMPPTGLDGQEVPPETVVN